MKPFNQKIEITEKLHIYSKETISRGWCKCNPANMEDTN
jgi:hypothetical protein